MTVLNPFIDPTTEKLFAIVPKSTAGAVTARGGDRILASTAAGLITVNAPANPGLRRIAFAVSDVDGAASVNNITVNGNGFLIDGAATVTLSANGVIAVFFFDTIQNMWRRSVVLRDSPPTPEQIQDNVPDSPLIATVDQDFAGSAGPPGPPGISADGAIFRPGAPSVAPVYATWAEIEAVIAASAGALTVYVDDSLAPAIVPATANTDFNYAGKLAPFKGSSDGSTDNILTIADGGRLRNLRAIDGDLQVRAAPTVVNPLQWTGPRDFVMRDGASLVQTGGAVPLISVPPGVNFALLAHVDGQISTTVPGVPMIFAGAGSTFVLVREDNIQANWDNKISGAPTATIGDAHDASATNLVPFAGYLGAIVHLVLDKAQNVEYAPAVPGNWAIPPDDVAEALDDLAARGAGLPSVPNVAALSLLNDAALPNYEKFTVVTLDAAWQLRKASTAVVDAITVAATLSGVGRWERIDAHAPRFSGQGLWTYDAVAGNDENDGSAAFPIKTLDELGRRLCQMDVPQATTIAVASNGAVLPQATINVASTAGFPSAGALIVTTSTASAANQSGTNIVSYTGITPTSFTGCTGGTGTMSTGGAVTFATKVSLLTNVPATDNYRAPRSWSSKSSGGVQVFYNLYFEGVETVVASDTTAAGTAVTNTATNTQAQTVSAGLPFAAHVDRELRFATGLIAFVEKDLGANTARVSEFYNPDNDTFPGAPPNGTAFDVVDYTEFAARFISASGPHQIQPVFSKVNVNNGTTWLGQEAAIYRRCRITNVGAIFNQNFRGRFFGVQIAPAAANTRIAAFQAFRSTFRGCGFRNVDFQPLDGAHPAFDTCILQSGELQVGRDTQTEVLSCGSAAITPPGAGGKGLGVFDATAAGAVATGFGVTVRRFGKLTVGGPLYGSGNAVGGLQCSEGGEVAILSTVTPTITGPTELSLDGAASWGQGLQAAAPSQKGADTLAAGTKAVATANITATSRILATVKDPLGAVQGVKLAVPTAGRVVGAPGSFTVNGVDVSGATVATDVSTFDWEVVNDLPVPLTTWANWAAAIVPYVSGFARNVVSGKTGAKIISYVNP